MKVTTMVCAAALGAMVAAPAIAAEKRVHESKAEIGAFANVKLSLQDAIAAAEKQTGGKAIDADFATKGGASIYKIRTVGNNAVTDVVVDAATGTVSTGKTTQASRLDREDKAEISAIQQAKVSLDQAARAAEQQEDGKAIAAGLEESGGQVAYEAEVVKDGAVKKVKVDPASGAVH